MLMLAACGSPPPPAAPPSAESAPPPPAASTAPVASAPEAPAPAPAASSPPAESAPEKKPEPEAEEKPSRPPLEIITAVDTAFLVNYSSSAANESARKTCSEKGGTDDEAIAKCMSEAREDFKADILRSRRTARTGPS